MKISSLIVYFIFLKSVISYSQSYENKKCLDGEFSVGNIKSIIANRRQIAENIDYTLDYNTNCIIINNSNIDANKLIIEFKKNVIRDISEKIFIDIHSYGGWYIASLPQKQPDLFPESVLIDSIGYGFNRARIAWYSIDPIFLRNNSSTPQHIKDNPDLQSNHFVREVFEKEIYPNRVSANNIPTSVSVINLAFYPEEKGSYNYDVNLTTFSSGIDYFGNLKNPESRWAGIMRKIEVNNFEFANIENIEFWLMDPFVYDTAHSGGEMYINIGEISEDILKDNRKSFENGLPTSSYVIYVDTTVWGRVPNMQFSINAFNNDDIARQYQDVGLDGLRDEDERIFFDNSINGRYNYLNSIGFTFGYGADAYTKAFNDPSSDDFHYFRGSDYDEQELGILDRYKYFNLPNGNSPTASQSNENYQTVGSILPDNEDINRNSVLDTAENYFQYQIYLKPDSMEYGINFINDTISYNARFKNGIRSWVKWYHFSIPINQYQKKVGDISDFKNIKFIRLFLKGFEKEVILRFATLDLVSGINDNYIIPEDIDNNRLYVYPNPNNGNFRIFINDKILTKIQIFNLSGIEIPLENYSRTTTSNLKFISISGLSKGIYIIKGTVSDKEFYQEKVVVY